MRENKGMLALAIVFFILGLTLKERTFWIIGFAFLCIGLVVKNQEDKNE